ncbi:MAG: NDP-sugar synthase [Deltaproteobacteria bacterium]|nr:NDP-sugar synthase [Deltaproteobacteria bacterium]
MFDAFVLAAGFGTRLRPLTEALPKPLVPVCGVPMLAYSLALCARHGLREVVVNAHHLAETLAPWEGEREGVRVSLSVEAPEILGTGGGLRAVARSMAPRFAVVNADVLNDVDLAALIARVPPGGGALALRSHPDAARYGVVAADAEGVVVRLASVVEAPPVGQVDLSTHFTGVHAMDRGALALIPEGGFACVVRTAYASLVPRRLVSSLRHGGLWLDVGDPAAYLDANLAVLDGGLRLPLDPFARAGWSRRGERATGAAGLVERAEVSGPAWVGAGAELGRARVSRSVIGAGAVVQDGAELVDSVVWEGSTVPAGRWERVVWGPWGALAR